MIHPSIIKDYYDQHQVMNPVNFTFTQKQVVDGQWISDTVSVQNFRHFSNKLNKRVFGNAFRRYGRKLQMFVVQENNETQRHHLHCIIECPDFIRPLDFVVLVQDCWISTRFGYRQLDFEVPSDFERRVGWVNYCLKRRTKQEYSSSIDWSNSTCFEHR